MKSNMFNTQNWNYDEINNNQFIYYNNKWLGFKRYMLIVVISMVIASSQLHQCDDCSECPLKNRCLNFNSKTNKKNDGRKLFHWEYFNPKLTKSFSEPKQKICTVEKKIQ